MERTESRDLQESQDLPENQAKLVPRENSGSLAMLALRELKGKLQIMESRVCKFTSYFWVHHRLVCQYWFQVNFPDARHHDSM